MTIKIIKDPFYKELLSIKPLIIKAVQKIYDDWNQEDDESENGICDEIEENISSIIISKTSAEETDLGGHDGDDHAWTIAKKGEKMYGINIPANIYEIGAGYLWKKRKGVKFKIDDVEIFEIK